MFSKKEIKDKTNSTILEPEKSLRNEFKTSSESLHTTITVFKSRKTEKNSKSQRWISVKLGGFNDGSQHMRRSNLLPYVIDLPPLVAYFWGQDEH